MGFPENELTSNEHVVMHLHPHWKAIFWPTGLLVVVLAGLGAAWAASLNSVLLLVLAAVGLVLIVWFFLIPLVKWRATHIVFTNERVITRSGVFSQHTENIPMDRVSDIVLDQSLFDRILGCGQLALASPGEHGPDQIRNVPHVKAVNVKLHELIDPDTNPPRPRSSSDGTTQTLSSDQN